MIVIDKTKIEALNVDEILKESAELLFLNKELQDDPYWSKIKTLAEIESTNAKGIFYFFLNQLKPLISEDKKSIIESLKKDLWVTDSKQAEDCLKDLLVFLIITFYKKHQEKVNNDAFTIGHL